MTVEKLIKEDDLTHCGTTFHDSRVNLHSAANIKGRKKKKCYTLTLDHRPPDHLTSHCYLHYRPDTLLCLQLGYSLYDAGYDVWLGNSRGNYYSRKHVNMTKSDPKFWDFSWHDMGVHDIPAVIDYILDHTGHKDLFFIGHSMGCAMFFVGMAAKPRYNDKIRVMFGLGPASYMHNGKSSLTTSIFKGLHYKARDFERLNIHEFLPRVPGWGRLALSICKDNHLTQPICRGGLSLMGGIFSEFDHGLAGNLKAYGMSQPPEYNLSRITAPVSLYCGESDLVVDCIDVERLHLELTNARMKSLQRIRRYTHLDFVWGNDAKLRLYSKIIKRMDAS
uniref:(California timema) hypothetical protein n=1 Tax=Timema californicum TaxID=61474 RepID=A0A7R9J2V2_TIMCA|nr:unnamed protein product [Timema californicum]